MVSSLYQSNSAFVLLTSPLQAVGVLFMRILHFSLTVSHVWRGHLEITLDIWKQMATDRDIKAVMPVTDYINPPPSFDCTLRNTEKGSAEKSPVHIQISSSSSREPN